MYENATGRTWCAPWGYATGDLNLLERLGRFGGHVHSCRDVAVLPLERLDLGVLAHLRTTTATGVKGGARHGE